MQTAAVQSGTRDYRQCFAVLIHSSIITARKVTFPAREPGIKCPLTTLGLGSSWLQSVHSIKLAQGGMEFTFLCKL